MKHALVVGASGVIGGAIARHLAGASDWRVTCVTRGGDAPQGAQGLSLDLLDETAVRRAASRMDPVTHVFYAAYQQRPTRTEEIAPNLAMLRHAIDIGEARNGTLERVILVTGGKYYGLQWGAIKTPARESDARHLGPNFYYDQQDHLAQRSIGAGWSWSHLIPPYVTGFSERAPMNLVMAIAVLATLSRELGMPLRFPGPAAAWSALHHLADAGQIASAASWAATSPSAANEIFNIANGDPGRWCNTWPLVAQYFDLSVGDPLPVPLVQMAEQLSVTWRSIAERHQLRQPDLSALVNWQWADYMFKTAFANDVLFELGKIRRAGFDACVDPVTALLGRFEELRSLRIIP